MDKFNGDGLGLTTDTDGMNRMEDGEPLGEYPPEDQGEGWEGGDVYSPERLDRVMGTDPSPG